ncbi:MAG: hypothetical protein MHM6MM_005798 [Cercozoa sp. M6MM]
MSSTESAGKKHSDEMINEYQMAFHFFDRSDTGKIAVQDLFQVMKELTADKPPTKAEIQQVMNEVDMDSDGAVNFKEFLQVMERVVDNSKLSIDYENPEEGDPDKRAFRLLDRQGEGKITRAALRQFMAQIGEKVTDSQAQEMIDEMATHKGSDSISFTEFMLMMQTKPEDQ